MAPDPSADATRLVPETAETPPAPAAIPLRQPDPSPTPVAPPPQRPPVPPSRTANRRTPVLLALLAVVVIAVVVLVVTSGGGGGGSGSTTVSATVVSGSGVAVHSAETLPNAPLALAPDTGDAWAATRDRLFQIAAANGTQIADQRPSPGPASALGVDVRGRVWVAGAGGSSVARQATRNVIATGSDTNLLALDSQSGLGRRPWDEHGHPRRPRLAERHARAGHWADCRARGRLRPAVGRLRPTATSRCWTATVIATRSRPRPSRPEPSGSCRATASGSSARTGRSTGSTRARRSTARPFPGTTSSTRCRSASAAAPPRSAPGRRRTRSGCSAPGRNHSSGSEPRARATGRSRPESSSRPTPGHLAVGDHVVWVDIPSAKVVIPISY